MKTIRPLLILRISTSDWWSNMPKFINPDSMRSRHTADEIEHRFKTHSIWCNSIIPDGVGTHKTTPCGKFRAQAIDCKSAIAIRPNLTGGYNLFTTSWPEHLRM